jgi:hypothetical protein
MTSTTKVYSAISANMSDQLSARILFRICIRAVPSSEFSPN